MSAAPDASSADVSRQLRELANAVAELRGEVRRSAGATLPREESAGWDDERPVASHAWVSSLATPAKAPVRIPRLPLELAFIAGAAVLAGFADLRPLEIGAVMAVAWVIVALAEWAGSRGDRMRAQIYLSPIAAPPPQPEPKADPTWFTPPVEHTLLTPVEQATAVTKLPPAVAPDADSEATAVTKLPPAAPQPDDPEATAEHTVGS
jgi:hypothetical protein